MNRKEMAQETLAILKKGFYEINGRKVEIEQAHQESIRKSKLYTPQDGRSILLETEKKLSSGTSVSLQTCVLNVSSVDAVIQGAHKKLPGLAVLNFASAKNPGGGFLNGAKAQEESLAVSSGLYETLKEHSEYYKTNRVCGTMSYTHYAIYSPEVVFFRNENGNLLPEPCTASVLTLPAVNYGQVLLKKEDPVQAKAIMKERMAICLALFAKENCKNLILGAYGCGVFRNDPDEISRWWKELLLDRGFGSLFDSVCFAVFDRSASLSCIRPFQSQFPG